MRLVDLDAVIDCIEMEWGYEGIREDLYSLPVVDAVPVVHAKWIPFHSEAAGDIQYCSAEVETALNIFKNVMKEDYARVLRCKDCKYGSYDSKPNGAMVCLRTNDGFWRKETDFCSYGERRDGGNDNVSD